VPPRFEKVWESWLTGIHDWNVSRQLWWGHRIPAWYCPDGHATVSAEEGGPDECETCGRPAAELTQDPDIFDTWYSSGLWPFSTLGWPDRTDDLRRYYPGTVMETGYDIIFFWVARMMMLGIFLADDVPFRKVYLHGLVKDPYGKRMSKTKGNVVDPLEAIDTAGADALRFALLNGTSPGNDQKFSNERLEDGRNFANKLWNATRFVLGAMPASVDREAGRASVGAEDMGVVERWLRSRATATIEAVDRAFADDNYGEVTRLLYDAIWSEFCDWGIELAKVAFADESRPGPARAATWWTLVDVLDTYLRLLHPVMPFVTEALWAALPRPATESGLLIVARWPSADPAMRDATLERHVGHVLDLVRAVRNARATVGTPAAAWLPLEAYVPEPLAPTFEALTPAIERLARVRPLTRVPDRDALERAPAGSLGIVAGDIDARLLAAAEPSAADRARIEKELAQANAALKATRARLEDATFLERAPANIVEGARAREAELAERVARLEASLG
jgi:valyl-tRNA synthetase